MAKLDFLAQLHHRHHLADLWPLAFCLVAAILGNAFFQHSREEFADVL